MQTPIGYAIMIAIRPHKEGKSVFQLHSEYRPTGDQPQAIEALTEGLQKGLKHQVLLGVTGSGKTFTMANIIKNANRPALVIAHNKTLAAQLAAEFREFFPENAVGYFVSYYDYYQPEAYIPSSDTFIEKDASVNDEIDRMRHSATSWLSERRDVVIVASVSCIYGLGDPEEYEDMSVSLREGSEIDRDALLRRLVDMQYTRNDFEPARGTFRVRGECIDIIPAAAQEKGVRVELFGDEIDRISEFEITTGKALRYMNHVMIFPASHYATSKEKMDRCLDSIEQDLEAQVSMFRENGRLLEAQRLEQRTHYDLAMMHEIGYCNGIENYSRYFDGRQPGDAPFTLLDYFPKDFLIFIDESHVTVPQIRAMYNGDYARKRTLVDFGFRLPSAFDNRPLKFHEFEQKTNQLIYVSATPGPYEMERAEQVVEQIIRPTGLIDPEIIVRPATGQVDDLRGRNPQMRGAESARAGHDADDKDGREPDGVSARAGYPRGIPAFGRQNARAREADSRSARRTSSTCWSASTCCARDWTCRRSRWWRFWTRTRRAFCGRKRRLCRRSAARRAMWTAGSSCMPTRSPIP